MSKGLFISPTEFLTFNESSRALTRAIATRERANGNANYFGSLPNPDPILKALGKDITTYRDLKSEPLVGSSIRRRKSAVKALERGIDKAQSTDAVVKFVEDVINGLDINRIIGEMLDAAFFGYQPMELMWQKRGSHFVIADIIAKPPEWFLFDDKNQLRFKSSHHQIKGEILPPRKFIVATQDASFDNPYGFPDLSMCYWPVTFKKGGWGFWVKFCEKYGTPWVIGKHPRHTTDSEITVMLDSMEKLMQDAVGAIPDDASIDIVESSGKRASSDIYKDLIELARSEIVIALLGQNQTTEANTNHASAQAGLIVTKDIRDGDAALVMSAFNQAIQWLVEVNFSNQPAPKWQLWEQESIDETQAKRDVLLSQTRGFFSEQYYQREYGLQPGDILSTETILHQGQNHTANLMNSDFAEHAISQDMQAQDSLDAALDNFLQNEPWDKTIPPIFNPLFEAVKSGKSPDELMGALAEIYPLMDADTLTEKLARVMFVANLLGRQTC